MTKRLVPLLFLFFSFLPAVLVADTPSDAPSLYSCSGVYQARPCSDGATAVTITGKQPISRYSSTETTAVDDPATRARLSLEKMEQEVIKQLIEEPSQIEARREPISRTKGDMRDKQKASVKPSLDGLERDVREMRQNLRTVIDRYGISGAKSKLTRLLTTSNALCTQKLFAQKINNRRRCEMLRRNLSTIARNINDSKSTNRAF